MTMNKRIAKLEEQDERRRMSACLAQLADAELDALDAITLQGGEAHNEEQQAALNRYMELWGLGGEV